MAEKVLTHPLMTEFPFMELSEIRTRRKMRSGLGEEVIACSPVEVDEGRGSYFNTVYEQGGKVFIRTMMGRSDKSEDVWVYARDEVTEIGVNNPDYQKARDLLRVSEVPVMAGIPMTPENMPRIGKALAAAFERTQRQDWDYP